MESKQGNKGTAVSTVIDEDETCATVQGLLQGAAAAPSRTGEQIDDTSQVAQTNYVN